jgi:methyl-accepting chemotaxis protein
MSTDLEQRVAKLEEFAADVREFTAAVRAMITRHDERLDEHAGMFRESDEKIAALADAQIKTEDALTRLSGNVDKLTAVVGEHTADGHGGQNP